MFDSSYESFTNLYSFNPLQSKIDTSNRTDPKLRALQSSNIPTEELNSILKYIISTATIGVGRSHMRMLAVNLFLLEKLATSTYRSDANLFIADSILTEYNLSTLQSLEQSLARTSNMKTAISDLRGAIANIERDQNRIRQGYQQKLQLYRHYSAIVDNEIAEYCENASITPRSSSNVSPAYLGIHTMKEVKKMNSEYISLYMHVDPRSKSTLDTNFTMHEESLKALRNLIDNIQSTSSDMNPVETSENSINEIKGTVSRLIQNYSERVSNFAAMDIRMFIAPEIYAAIYEYNMLNADTGYRIQPYDLFRVFVKNICGRLDMHQDAVVYESPSRANSTKIREKVCDAVVAHLKQKPVVNA